MAQATSWSPDRLRNRHTMAVAYPPSTTPHSRIDPARADHSPVMEYSHGVARLLLAAT